MTEKNCTGLNKEKVKKPQATSYPVLSKTARETAPNPRARIIGIIGVHTEPTATPNRNDDTKTAAWIFDG
jgi:hypothetical protein